MWKTFGRALVVAGFSLVAFAASAAAQGATPSRDPMLELLAEVKAMRAEMRAASEASVQAQLLVARLQLQEQRITTLSRQLNDVQRQLSDNERGRAPLAAQVAAMSGDASVPASEREEREQAVQPLKSILEQLEKGDRDLKAQETHLMGLIAEEQARWVSFNARLDELAKHIESRVK
jgi:hypothetical protein